MTLTPSARPGPAWPPPTRPVLATRPNLRSLGGLPVTGGQRLAEGLFYRATALTALAAAEADAIAALDLALVVDFRQSSEAAASPVHLPARADALRLALPIRTGAAAHVLTADAGARVDGVTARAAMIEVYRDFVRESAETFGAFLAAAAAADGPVLFHCTAGKDRTGFAAALLLSALGASRETVVADFLATAGLWTPDADLVARIPLGARQAVLGVSADYIDAALDELDRHHGGAAAFARDVLGDAGLRAWTRRATIPDVAVPAAPLPQETT